MKKIFLLIIVSISFQFSSCREINCDEAGKSYEHWAGQKAPKDVQVISGQYWQSPHFSLEYILYLKVKPSKIWWDGLIKENAFVLDTAQWTPPSDAPRWFRPAAHCKKWKPSDDFQDSRILQDSVTGNCYLYFIQL